MMQSIRFMANFCCE